MAETPIKQGTARRLGITRPATPLPFSWSPFGASFSDFARRMEAIRIAWPTTWIHQERIDVPSGGPTCVCDDAPACDDDRADCEHRSGVVSP